MPALLIQRKLKEALLAGFPSLNGFQMAKDKSTLNHAKPQ